ncbi:sodium-dependent glucose transporter 1A-like [Mercenaria mercenaria]|uniref:sodium-dependent glucose transporter 1A-like n=1 Tax=Mercenaria mercenaria TaxID=6596 RepID=UPI00234E9094|nr:sodium-dependent glucose transporter 1A-like [Mercenaria mercenaria]
METEITGQLQQMNSHQGTGSKFRSNFSFKNECQKKNFIQTCCVYFNFILLGWTYGQLGTAFQDLQLILGTNVEQTSLLFTVNSVGYMAGSLTIGFIYDKVEHLKLLGAVSLINAVTSTLSPWCTKYGLFLFVRLLDGFLAGGRDSGGNAKIMSCWGKEGGPFMLALHFTYSIGGIISPLVTRFFLAPKLTNHENSNNTSEMQILNVSSNYSISDLYHNISLKTNQEVKEIATYGETKIHWAFLITGLLTALSGFIYITLFCKGFERVPTYVKPTEKKIEAQTSSKDIERVRLSKNQTVLFVILIALSVTSSTAVECKGLSFIMPFVLLQLNWSKSNGAFLISLLWTFYSIGRFSGIIVSRFVRPHKIIIANSFVIIISCGVLYFGAVYNIAGIVWTMVPLMGVGISCMFPTFIVWTHENVLKISGKVGGFFQFCGSLGCFIDPLYIGALMENVSPLYFVYFQIIQCTFTLVVFVINMIWVAKMRRICRTHRQQKD